MLIVEMEKATQEAWRFIDKGRLTHRKKSKWQRVDGLPSI